MAQNTIVHHLLTKQQLVTPGQLSPVYILGMTFYGLEYPFDQFRSNVLTVLPTNFLGICSLAEQEMLDSPWLSVSITQ